MKCHFCVFEAYLFNLFSGEVTQFLRKWFARLTANVAPDYTKNIGEVSGHREKRDVRPPLDFEVIAQEYLLNETKQYLTQFLGYAEYLNVTQKESLQEIYQREERRLSTMSTKELFNYMTSLSKSLRFGTSGSTININGQTYDLSHVGSWCCPF
jgi:hypothetical protein